MAVAPQRTAIEPACRADVDAIVGLRRAAVLAQAGGCYEAAQVDSWLAHPLDGLAAALAGGDGIVLVARQEGGLAGFAWASGGPRAHLRSLYVAPGAMRRGTGSALLAAAEAAMRQAGAPELWLAATLNAAAFYLHRGYVHHRRFTWQLPGRPTGSALPLFSMSKRLVPA